MAIETVICPYCKAEQTIMRGKDNNMNCVFCGTTIELPPLQEGEVADFSYVEEQEQIRLRHEQEAANRLAKEQQEAEERQKALEANINNLKAQGYEGYYEYTTIELEDYSSGELGVYSITDKLNEYAMKGWRLVSAYANEIGHTSSSNSYGGYSSGTNATIDQHILILERFVKI